MKVGFTGTRQQPTPDATMALSELLARLQPTEAHHGDCVGADAIFHWYVLTECVGVKRVIHPPTNKAMRAFCTGTADRREPKPYLERNRDIVDETDVLLAMPQTAEETIRSGTWSTVRYARKAGKKIYIINPDGTVKEE